MTFTGLAGESNIQIRFTEVGKRHDWKSGVRWGLRLYTPGETHPGLIFSLQLVREWIAPAVEPNLVLKDQRPLLLLFFWFIICYKCAWLIQAVSNERNWFRGTQFCTVLAVFLTSTMPPKGSLPKQCLVSTLNLCWVQQPKAQSPHLLPLSPGPPTTVWPARPL